MSVKSGPTHTWSVRKDTWGVVTGLRRRPARRAAYRCWCQRLPLLLWRRRRRSAEVHPGGPFMPDWHRHPSSGLSASKWQRCECPTAVHYVKEWPSVPTVESDQRRRRSRWPLKLANFREWMNSSRSSSKFSGGAPHQSAGAVWWCPLLIEGIKKEKKKIARRLSSL